MSCKPERRDAKKPDLLVIAINYEDLKVEKRSLLPVFYCNDNSGAQAFEGGLTKPPRESFTFSISEGRPLVGNVKCFIDVFSSETNGLKIDTSDEKIIEGNQYKVMYQSNIVSFTQKAKNFVFKKNYEEVNVETKIFTLRLVLKDSTLKGDLSFYCKETEIVKPTLGMNETTYDFIVNNTDILGDPEYLNGCIIKNTITEDIYVTGMPDKFNYKATNFYIYNVNEVKAIKASSENTAKIYESFSGFKYKARGSLPCEFYLEFFKEDTSYLYEESIVSTPGCLAESYKSGKLPYSIFTKHPAIPSLEPEKKILIKFKKPNASVKYSLVEILEDGFKKIGGNITKIELLEGIESGLTFEVKN